jgi:hypothetical protein
MLYLLMFGIVTLDKINMMGEEEKTEGGEPNF